MAIAWIVDQALLDHFAKKRKARLGRQRATGILKAFGLPLKFGRNFFERIVKIRAVGLRIGQKPLGNIVGFRRVDGKKNARNLAGGYLRPKALDERAFARSGGAVDVEELDRQGGGRLNRGTGLQLHVDLP